MTTRVYYQGNLSDPTSVKLFDADTGKQLDDVAEVQVTVSAAKQQVDLRRVNSTALERCELVQPPPHRMAGKVFAYTSLEIENQAAQSRRLYRAQVQEFEVQSNGELEQRVGVFESTKWVDDHALALAPPGTAAIHAADALREAVGGAIIDPIMGQAGMQVPPIPFPAPPLKESRKYVCPECKGIGEVLLFSGPSPCSQGCKKP